MNEVKEDESYIANFAYGGSDARHIWPEPKEDQTSALYLDANFEKTFKIDDVSSVFHYELIDENGGLNTYMTGDMKGEIRCSDFDGMLHEDELTNLPLAVSFSHPSEDHFLDVDFAKKVPDLDCKFCDELSGDNLRSEIHSPGTSNDEVGVSESSILEPRCFIDLFGKVPSDGMHGDSCSTCMYERPVEDKKGFTCSLTSDTQDVLKTKKVLNTLEIGCSFSHGGNKTHFSLSSIKKPCSSMGTEEEVGSVSQCTEVDDFCVDDPSTDSCAEINVINTRQRRLCRPPQRYLDGSLWLKTTEKKQSISLSKDKDLGVRSHKKHQRKALKTRVPLTKTRNLEFDSDEEYEPDESCFNVKRGDRRKNSKAWTLEEVEALVDGMSKFGTGQWTAVKNAAFLYSRRTATDIRDKWRNLVKTNCKSSRSRKDYQCLRTGTHPLPVSLIEQVREIANAPKSSSKRGQGLSNRRGSDMS